MFKNMFEGKKVLVTGHTGFKGSWLSLWLHKLGANVVGLSVDIPTNPSNYEVCQLENIIKNYKVDVRNYQDVYKVFQIEEPEIIFHLAAQPITRLSYEMPKETIDTNLGGTLNILECIRNFPFVKSAIMVTSDKCYQNVEWVWGYRENDKLGGDDPYSASKGASEVIIHSYNISFFNRENSPKVCSVRAGNVIGGGDWALDRIVPDCVRAFSEDKTVEIRNPHSTRPWQHVLEPLSGYISLASSLLNENDTITGGAYNFGPKSGSDKTVEDLIKQISLDWKGQFDVKSNSKNLKEANLLRLNCDKSLNDIGWKGILNFEQTVKMTSDWYQAYYNKSLDMREFTLNQISEYEKVALHKKISWAL